MMKSLEAGVFPLPLCKLQLQVASQIVCFKLLSFTHFVIKTCFCFCKVSVFAESQPSDMAEPASQSVPMVSTSTAAMGGPGEAVPGDDADDVFMAEVESEG